MSQQCAEIFHLSLASAIIATDVVYTCMVVLLFNENMKRGNIKFVFNPKTCFKYTCLSVTQENVLFLHHLTLLLF